jgi:hypothetical protein
MGCGHQISDPAEMQEALRSSYAALKQALSGLSDNDLKASVKMFGPDTTKHGVALMLIFDQYEPRAIGYAPSNSVVPPGSKARVCEPTMRAAWSGKQGPARDLLTVRPCPSRRRPRHRDCTWIGRRISRSANGRTPAVRAGSDVIDGARAIAPKGVHHIVEVAFGANVATDLELLALDGSIATYATDAATPPIPFWPLLFKNIRVFFIGSNDFPRPWADRAGLLRRCI